MPALPPPIKKALLISCLCHLVLFALLQVLLVSKGGSAASLESVLPPSMSVRIRYLSNKHVAVVPPEPAQAPEAPPATAQPAASTESETIFGLDFFAPPLYIPAGELNERPQVIQDIPSDAAQLLSLHPDGVVIMRLQINEQGTVDDVVIEETNIAVRDLQTLMTLFRGTVFSPGIKNGKPVKSELRIEVVVETPPTLPLPRQPAKR